MSTVPIGLNEIDLIIIYILNMCLHHDIRYIKIKDKL